MHGIPFEIPLFLFATFVGAFVAGLSGFAFGLVAASLWLYILTPVQTATLIVAFGLISVYAFFRPALKFSGGGRAGDAAVGLLNGALGGLTGLAGILVTIWCGLRGWPKDVQRTVFQPVAVAIFLMSAIWLGAKGTVTAETAKFFVMGLPCVLGGTWLGLKLFGRIDEATFRKIVLALLFLSGVTLLF